MKSKRQLAANRANAKKSSGPRTEAGREKVAQNATKHGLSGGNFQVLSCENQDEYNALFERFLQAEKPVGDVERELVVKMARHTWLSERALRCQEGCFLVQPRTPEEKENRQHGIAVRADLEIYVRYQAAHDRAYQRASKELQERRKQRTKDEIGFVSQKRAEAQEARREAKENRDMEVHQYVVAYRAERLEQEIIRTRKLTAAVTAPSAGPQLVKTSGSGRPATQDIQGLA